MSEHLAARVRLMFERSAIHLLATRTAGASGQSRLAQELCADRGSRELTQSLIGLKHV